MGSRLEVSNLVWPYLPRGARNYERPYHNTTIVELSKAIEISSYTLLLIKVSVYPKFDHFSKKMFFAFSDRSYCNLSFKKKFYEKRLILSKVINEKRFFPLIASNG